MGRLTTVRMLGVDTNCFIHLFEDADTERGRLASDLFAPDGSTSMVTSVLTLSELLVKPLREGSEQDAAELREAFVQLPRLEIVDVDSRIAETAARIRAATNLKLSDAIHVATAIEHGAEAFLSNDARFQRASAFVPIMVLDELIVENTQTGA